MIFSELDYRLSNVLRWSVLYTIRKQSVSEHTYNVAIIAERIMRRMTDDRQMQHAALLWALYHDHDESVTGDFPSYMKPHVNGDFVHRLPAYDDEEMTASDGAGDIPLVRFVVKCADYIDAMVFLRMEVSLGNKTVVHHLRNMEYRFRKFIEEAQGEVTADAHKVLDWYNEDIVDRLFGGNGQYISEIHGFPKE